jgi:hypothetical protein
MNSLLNDIMISIDDCNGMRGEGKDNFNSEFNLGPAGNFVAEHEKHELFL